MKILFITPQPFFRERGTPLRSRNKILALTEAGHQVDLLCYPFGDDLAIPGMTIHRSWRCPGIRDVRIGPSLAKVPLDLLLCLKAIGLCLRGRYDVITAVEEAGFFAAWLARIFRCRFVYDMDSYISDHLRFSGFVKARPVLALAESLERSTMRSADVVVTVGDVLSDVVRRAAPSTRILQLEDVWPEDGFTEDRAGAERLREEFGVRNGSIVVYTGNFAVYQGAALLVEAAGLVARERPETTFFLVGGEPPQVEEMKALAARHGADRCCIFTGTRPVSEMPAFITLANVLVSPRNKGTNPPMKIYPYMQSGRPIVATRVPTHTQVLDDSCAILTEADPKSLAAGISRALGERDTARRLGDAAAARAAERYSWSVFRRKIQSAYGALCNVSLLMLAYVYALLESGGWIPDADCALAHADAAGYWLLLAGLSRVVINPAPGDAAAHSAGKPVAD